MRDRTTRVVLDIVRRYDIDALHIDDYFYPYKESKRGREIPFPDDATYARYRRGGGTMTRDDWRRENVNLLVRQLNTAIHDVKPWVRFGISPFGIWRPGNPPSVRGLDQYSEIFADARKWVRQGWADYFTPQLYWSVDKPEQRYDQLLKWWVDENVHGRHMWPGNYTGKMLLPSFHWPASEIVEQIRLTRAQPGATGNVHFSMKVFLDDPDGLNERLMAGPYAQPALVPATPWLSVGTPPAPSLGVHSGRHDAASDPRHPADRGAAGADRRRRNLHRLLDAMAVGRADAERRGMDDGDRSRRRALAPPGGARRRHAARGACHDGGPARRRERTSGAARRRSGRRARRRPVASSG